MMNSKMRFMLVFVVAFSSQAFALDHVVTDDINNTQVLGANFEYNTITFDEDDGDDILTIESSGDLSARAVSFSINNFTVKQGGVLRLNTMNALQWDDVYEGGFIPDDSTASQSEHYIDMETDRFAVMVSKKVYIYRRGDINHPTLGHEVPPDATQPWNPMPEKVFTLPGYSTSEKAFDLNGNWLVVAGQTSTTADGSVEIYRYGQWDLGENDPNWSWKLIETLSKGGEGFGKSVAMRGTDSYTIDTLAIGAPNARITLSDGSIVNSAGRVYLLTWDPSADKQFDLALARTVDAGEYIQSDGGFGSVVKYDGRSIEEGGGTLVVSSEKLDKYGTGDELGIFIFNRFSVGSSQWTQAPVVFNEADLGSERAIINDNTLSLAVDGNTVVIGGRRQRVPDQNGNKFGLVHILEGSLSQQPNEWYEWNIVKTIDASLYQQPEGYVSTDSFGRSVSVSGNLIGIGAEHAQNTGLIFSGRAFILERQVDSSGISGWGPLIELQRDEVRVSDSYGYSISVWDTDVDPHQDIDNVGVSIESLDNNTYSPSGVILYTNQEPSGSN